MDVFPVWIALTLFNLEVFKTSNTNSVLTLGLNIKNILRWYKKVLKVLDLNPPSGWALPIWSLNVFSVPLKVPTQQMFIKHINYLHFQKHFQPDHFNIKECKKKNVYKSLI